MNFTPSPKSLADLDRIRSFFATHIDPVTDPHPMRAQPLVDGPDDVHFAMVACTDPHQCIQRVPT
jgi:hypothetical protein